VRLEFSSGYDVRSVPAGASRVTITAADGFALAAQTFGNAATCRAGVLLVGAMGVDQRYYGAFAHGHFGFFREHYAQHLWPLTAAWFHQFVH